MSAIPIGVNAPMTSPQVTATASEAARCDLRSTAQMAAVALIRISALVGAASSQDILEM